MADAYLPGTASLLQELDKRLLVALRDGRTLIGYLRSIDQFANLVLHQSIERIYVGKKYGDINRGIIIIRGENVILFGEMESETKLPADFEKVDERTILHLQHQFELGASFSSINIQETVKKREANQSKRTALRERGLLLTSTSDPIQEEFYLT